MNLWRNKSHKRDQDVHVCVDGMDGRMNYSLLTHSFLYSFLIFYYYYHYYHYFRHGSPSLFFLDRANHDINNSGYLFWRERLSIQGVFIWWMMDDVDSQCRNFADGGGRVCGLYHKSMKRFPLWSHSLTTLNDKASNICKRFCNKVLI